MKSVFLSVVVVCALAIAGIGGTFATWSDSETSMGNTITTGSVDLKVNGYDDVGPTLAEPLWGEGVPAKVTIDCMIPCKWYGPYEVELWNAGVCTEATPSKAYIHFKEACCGNALPKDGSGYMSPDGAMKPEPELVAEYGGRVDSLYVPGIGVTGDDCSMLSHVEVIVCDEETGDRLVGPVPLVDIMCEEIYLFDLIPCNARTINLWFHLIQESEEDYDYDFIPDPGDTGYDELYWKKFNDWPSWALMRDTVVFSIEFDLFLDVPDDEPPCPVVPVPGG
jgi:predicted ribosomally synthesized peptide with SipW-like signal peptide